MGIAQLSKTIRDNNAAQNRERENRVIIALMGRTRAGKSTFIDAFTGREELRRSYGAIEDRRRTREVQQADEYEDETGRKIMFVEMPGFFDDPPSDMTILKRIAEYLDASCKYYKIAGVIYLQDANCPITSGAENEYNIGVMADIVGKDCYTQIVLNEHNERNRDTETALVRSWQRIRIKTGKEMLRLGNISASPFTRNIVQELLLEGQPRLLALQEELQRKPLLRKTKAGTTISSQIKQTIKNMEADLKALRKERNSVSKNPGRSDPDALRRLTERMQAVSDGLEELKQEQKLWKILEI